MGTGKVINDFEKLIPDLKKIDIVDIDPFIPDLARKYFGFLQAPITNIHIQDGRVFARNTKEKYDLVIVDVAGNDGIPYRFMTQEFSFELREILTEKGIVIANMFGSELINSEKNVIPACLYKTYKSVFREVSFFRCDYSDYLFYKTFYDKDYKLMDITNILFVASNSINASSINNLTDADKEKFNNIGIKNLELYTKDLHTEAIQTENFKILKDCYQEDSEFTIENFKNYVKT